MKSVEPITVSVANFGMFAGEKLHTFWTSVV